MRTELDAKDQKMNREMTRFNEGQSDTITTETGDTRRLDVQAVTRPYQDEMEALNKRLSTSHKQAPSCFTRVHKDAAELGILRFACVKGYRSDHWHVHGVISHTINTDSSSVSSHPAGR